MPAQTVTDGLDTPRVDGKAKRKRRKRTKSATTLRRINAAARERQEAYAEGNKANVTQRLTTELNGPEHLRRPEGLFAEARQEGAGEMPAGRPTTNGMYL